MITGHTAQQIRTTERPLIEAGVPLMARAAHALAQEALDMLREHTGGVHARRVLLLVGPGANGGDALYAGAALRRRGVAVRAIATTDTVHEGGAQDFLAAGGRLLYLSHDEEATEHATALRADLVIDGILGSGGRPGFDTSTAALLHEVRATGSPVLAVDVPSGMDATTGAHDEATLPAERTLAIGSIAQGLLLPDGAQHAGRIVPCMIGLEDHLPEPAIYRLDDADVAAMWPAPAIDATKYTRGVVGVVAGSTNFPGAAVLAVEAACRMGAGMVRILAPESVRAHVITRRPEAVGADGRVQALCVGPGVPGDDARLGDALDRILDGTPAVIDAGGIDALADHWGDITDVARSDADARIDTAKANAAHPNATPLPASTVLTPHRGEAERLARAITTMSADEITALSALDLVRLLARTSGATVLLKGPVTLVSAPDGRLFSQADAVPQLATAGAGDVLAGTLATLLAQGLDAAKAAACAALIHGRAARLASRGGVLPLTALTVAQHLPAALATILGEVSTAAAPRVGRGHRTLSAARRNVR